MIQGGQDLGFDLIADRAFVFCGTGGGTGGICPGGLGPGMVCPQLGNGFRFGFFTAGAAVINRPSGGAGCIFTVGFLPVVVQGRGGLLFHSSAAGAGIAGLAWSNASGVRLAGDSPDMAGAQLGDGFCLGFITTGAAIANHTGDKAGSGCTGGFDPVVLQSGEGFGLFGRTDGTDIINLSGSGAGGRGPGRFSPGVVLGQLGNSFHLGFITAGTVVIDGSCGDAGCRGAAGFRPVVA